MLSRCSSSATRLSWTSIIFSVINRRKNQRASALAYDRQATIKPYATSWVRGSLKCRIGADEPWTASLARQVVNNNIALVGTCRMTRCLPAA